MEPFGPPALRDKAAADGMVGVARDKGVRASIFQRAWPGDLLCSAGQRCSIKAPSSARTNGGPPNRLAKLRVYLLAAGKNRRFRQICTPSRPELEITHWTELRALRFRRSSYTLW